MDIVKSSVQGENVVPAVKRIKIEEESSLLVRISNKIVRDINSILALTDCDEKVDISKVNCSVGDNGIVVAKVQCVLCDPVKVVKLHATKNSVDVANFKSHFSRTHLAKGSELKKGAKIVKRNQPKLTAFLVPAATKGTVPLASTEQQMKHGRVNRIVQIIGFRFLNGKPFYGDRFKAGKSELEVEALCNFFECSNNSVTGSDRTQSYINMKHYKRHVSLKRDLETGNLSII